jgi:exosortase family protein XrtM
MALTAIIFVALFFAMQFSYELCRGSSFEHWVIGDLTVKPTARVLQWLSPEVGVQALGNQLRAAGGGLVVKKGCEGVEIMFMLVAAFAAACMSWRRKLLGLGLGLVVVFVLNQIRLVGLFYAYRYNSELFGLLHGTVAPIVLVLLVGLYSLAWFKPSRDPVNGSNAGDDARKLA